MPESFPRYDPGARVVRFLWGAAKAAWVVLAAFVALLASGLGGTLFESSAYCGPEDGPAPITTCFPSWGENPWPTMATVAIGASVFAALTAPLWVPWRSRRGGGRSSGKRP